MFDALQDFTSTIPSIWQWAGVALVAAIPFVESYFGSVIGVLAGVPTGLAIAAAVVGNVVSMLLFVLSADRVRRGVRARKGGNAQTGTKNARFLKLFNKYGIPGVSLLGQTVLPSQITSAMLVSLTGERNKVILWQLVSIVLWGTVFGLLAMLGIVSLS